MKQAAANSMHRRRMNQHLRSGRVALWLMIMLLALAQSSHAIIYLDSQPDSAPINAVTNAIFAGRTLSLTGYVQGNPTNFHTSATYLDQWNILFTAHQTTSGGTPITYTTVSTAPTNFINDPGVTANLKDVVVAPGYNPDGSTWDLAIGHLQTPLPRPPGVTNDLTKPLTFPDVSQNQQVWGLGCGTWGHDSGSHFLPDGNFRAGIGPVDADAHGFSDACYFTVRFFSDGSLGPMNIRVANLDSGGTWFDASGNPIGISDAANTVYTIVERLSNPDIQNWINANRIFPPALNITAAGSNVVLWWTNAAYSLQSATVITGTFTDVTNATSPWTNSITVNTQQFFRLRPN